ncbi:type III secretion protein [Yersinia kristensenii]|uniref:type III secretion protein n=1 Tax=Yersinia kristensenii TaxID=28152 RepID=UPI001C610EFB|nr:type III secretion protein [Yersinia kristensenii]MBW5817945.1 type III secretion protein [Yersinia kristensenii]MBW5842261.1 type III secretion protein [Yersinia kristensenii]
MINYRGIIFALTAFLLTGCQDSKSISVATFESADIANKVLVLLSRTKINAELVFTKNGYSVHVETSQVMQARTLLSKYNFYFEVEDLNDLLESKFASLSKLETIKGNLLEGREIYNKLNVIPDVLRSNVMVSGAENKRVSVLLISLNEIDYVTKNSIEKFLKGIISEKDTLTVEYLVQTIADE